MLIQRIITGFILAIIAILGIIFLPPHAFILVNTAIMLFGAWEWGVLMGLPPTSRWIYAIVIGLIMCIFCYRLIPMPPTVYTILTHVIPDIPIAYILYAACLWWMIAIFFIVTYPKTAEWWAIGIYVRGLMGIFVLIPCWLAVNTIRLANGGIATLFYLLYITWAADIGAYFAGRWWGKHALMPKVSPKKTIEGAYGGLLLSVTVGIIASSLFDLSFHQWVLLVGLTVITVLFSIVGDLFKSMLKRNIGIKDMGNYLPGHGGLLDRIDSLTAAAPVFLLGLLGLLHFL